MNRDEVLDLLRSHKPVLADRFGVTSLALFGSFARDEATDSSDVDILVEFSIPPDWQTYFGAVFYLEDLVGRPVEMASNEELRPEIRSHVMRHAVNV
jgi:predicted nucleotidyltransferase